MDMQFKFEVLKMAYGGIVVAETGPHTASLHALSAARKTVNRINQETGGRFLAYLGGYMPNHHILLKNRRADLDGLRASIPAVSNRYCRKFLKLFVHIADTTFARYKGKAALLIL